MFSVRQKREKADAIQKILREFTVSRTDGKVRS